MDFLRWPRKSTLGTHRSGVTTSNDTAPKKFEMHPKSLQIAETQRKQRTATNNENAYGSNIKNVSTRQPRKSMLGTRKASRNSILLQCEPLLPPHDLDSTKTVSDSSADVTLKSNESFASVFADRINSTSNSSIENRFSRKDNVLQEQPLNTFRSHSEPVTSPVRFSKPTKPASPVLHRNIPIREMSPCTLSSKENSFIVNETTISSEESILATTITDTTISSESSCLGTTLKDITNTCVDRTTIDEVTLRSVSVDESQEENDHLFKMLDLINTWMRRSTEAVELYEKEIAGLQEKKAQAREEIEHMKNLKSTLMKQFSVETETDYTRKLDCKPMTTIPEDQVYSTEGSPTKTYFQEMRSTIKFIKTPLTSRTRAPRQSVMLTPHSMSFCLKSQYEQLFG